MASQAGGSGSIHGSFLGTDGSGMSASDGMGLVRSVAMGPNISNGQQPIRFLVNLDRSAKIELGILALTGERVFTEQILGTQGLNTLVWEAQNNAGSTVASGLYLYYLQVDDGVGQETRSGKIVILR